MLIESLQRLKNYRFSLREYKINHSELVLSAINPDNVSFRFNIGFADVYYIQLPTSWIGSFEIGSDKEREEIIYKTSLPIGGFDSNIKLYKSLQGEVRILGVLMRVEPNASDY